MSFDGPILPVRRGINGLKIKLSGRQGHNDSHLDQGQFLADAIPRPLLERPPRIFVRLRLWERRVGEPFEVALGDEGARLGEVGLVAVEGVGGGPNGKAVCWV